MNKKLQIDKVEDGMGNIVSTRPEKQNVQPKAFKGQPAPFVMICFSEPTDRYILWFLYHYPFGFNQYFISDLMAWNPAQANNPESAFSKYMKHIKSLKDRRFIKENKDHTEWQITTKGQIYRLYTNTTFQFLGITIGVLLTLFGIFKDDIFKQANKSDNKTTKKTEQTAPTFQGDSSQIQRKLNLDSSLIQPDTSSKTKGN